MLYANIAETRSLNDPPLCTMSDIFFSYCHDDRIKVTRLVRALEAQGWTTWWDRDLVPGTLWDQTIARELRAARCVIVAWSGASTNSSFVKEEAGLALAQDKLLPVSLDQVAPPKQFSSIETLDLSRWLGSHEDQNFVLLKRGVERLVRNDVSVSGHLRPDHKLNKNRSALKIWGITIGGTFYGFASGVIAKPLAVTASAILIAVLGVGGYSVISRHSTSQVPFPQREVVPVRRPAAVTRMPVFSPDGRRVVTGSGDGTAHIWDANTGKPIGQPLRGHKKEVMSAQFNPDGSRIVTASRDNTARIWNAWTGQQIAVLSGHESDVNIAGFSPDGSRIVTASFDRTTRIWDVATARQITVLEVEALSADFSPDGRRMVTASPEGSARIWDANAGRMLFVLEGDMNTAEFSPDGRRVVTGSGDGTARIWDADTGQMLVVLGGHAGRVNTAEFSPDGRRVVTGSGDGTAHIWDVGTGQMLVVLEGHAGRVNTAEFSPDGRRVVTGSGDGTARIWDANTGEEIALLGGQPSRPCRASFSRDGLRIVTICGHDDEARIWDATTGMEIAILQR